MKNGIRSFLFWLPATVITLWIFILSSIPGDIFPEIPWDPKKSTSWFARNPDKVVHFLLYWVLALALVYGFYRSTRFHLWTACLTALGVASFYGMTDEWHQLITPRRSCDIYDWVADTAGAMVGVFLFFIYHHFRSKSKFDQPHNN